MTRKTMDSVDLIVTCGRGLSRALAFELKDMGATDIAEDDRAVHCRGDVALMVRANIGLRTASRVLLQLQRRDNVHSVDDVEEMLRAYPFEKRLSGKGTFAVDAHLHHVPWTHSRFAAQRVKDIIVERVVDAGRGRPSVDIELPSVQFVFHWRNDVVTLAVDTSGASLHERGYRRGVDGEAPLRETVAAGLLAIGNASVDVPFLDPCCGTGTLAIEQAYRALKKAPNADRRFGFERWSERPPELDRALAAEKTRARDDEKKTLPAPIFLSDWHRNAISDATQCIENAGLAHLLHVERCDARDAVKDMAPGKASVVANLPFGKRLGEQVLQLRGFYWTLTEAIVSRPSTRALLFSGHADAKAWLAATTPKDVRMSTWPIDAGDLAAHLFRLEVRPPPQLA
jgi:23S rRNA G2445 N2-methylase RlmL